MMGYRTPNIDRLACEGLSFTDYYGQESCTGEGVAAQTFIVSGGGVDFMRALEHRRHGDVSS